jgi:geranylgeranyl pyrophosphate synthase/predicted secreted hydrolase
VWRSFRDFRMLDAALQKETRGAFVSGALFPKSKGWWGRTLGASVEDYADLRRCLLENYLQAALAHPQAGKTRALRTFLKPSDRPDWPASVGAIDLAVHDLPHESSATEWWYYNCHFQDEDGNDYSGFAALFRVVKHTDKATGAKSYAHALNWALTDVKRKKYVQEIVLDKDSPAIVRKQLDAGMIKDVRLEKAYREILDRGNVPLPDRMFSKGRDAIVSRDKLFLDYESTTVTKDKAGRYVVTCTTPDGQTGMELVFTPQKAPVRHGLDGVVKGHDGDDMFYYCISRCAVSGYFTVNGQRKRVVNGQGWYDHEFGGVSAEEDDVPRMDYAWNWAAIQLDNGHEVSVAVLKDPRSTPHRLMESRAVVVDAAGERTQPADLEFTELNQWTSVRTFNTYPTHWHVSMPSAGIELELKAPFDDQEFMTLIAKPGFWEGRVDVTGTFQGQAVKGVAYVERNGFQTLSELDGFFKAVGAETRRAVREVYPNLADIDEKKAVQLIATPETPWYIDGVDFKTFHDGIIKPVRYISDMGGKSWRSYGALACMDVVGGDSRKYTRWLSMPEFMHVGSLIVDDIEDGSTKRRGVDCAHIIFGEPTAINAGTAAYFQGQQLLLVPGLTAEQLNRVYDFYFAALRAGHAGQALDIAGLGYLMDDVLERGDGALAESRLVAVHRLKTAVPAASLARMGALVGGGSDAQIDAVGSYYESIGIAFQIMDDVLNLRGLYTSKADKKAGVELKNLGEDITAGKVTMPVVKAITLLPKDEMRALWEIIKTKPTDRTVVMQCIQKLEDCGAIQACVDQSISLVEDAFKRLDPVVPDSFSKIMLRAFGWFVTEQGKA